MSTTVTDIVRAKLCHGCGTCAGVCPLNAITMHYSTTHRTYIPFIDPSRCTPCAQCYHVCPGLHPVLPPLAAIPGSQGHDPLPAIGSYQKCFTGYANDAHTRFSASSGGIATALSLYLLASKRTNAVVATRIKEHTLCDTEPVLCTSQSQVLSAMGSKYCPAATNTILREIAEAALASVVYVGLPCHIQGVYKAHQLHLVNTGTCITTIGLLCGGMRGQEGTRWILKKQKLPLAQIDRIQSHRGHGWPGSMLVTLINHKEHLAIPYAEYGDALFESWQPWRCSLCLDRTSLLADISLGDAWLPELRADTQGTSLIIARTAQGLQILEDAVRDHIITLSEVNRDTLIASQRGLWRELSQVHATLALARMLRKKIPEYDRVDAHPGWEQMFRQGITLARRSLLRILSCSDRLYYTAQKIRHLTRTMVSPRRFRCIS